MERNLCLESGCHGVCCRNVFFNSLKGCALSEEEININFEKIYVTDQTDADDLTYQGLIQIGPNKKHLYLNGMCPQYKNGCVSPLKPGVCKEGTPFGGIECNKLRKIAGLTAIKGIDIDGNILLFK